MGLCVIGDVKSNSHVDALLLEARLEIVVAQRGGLDWTPLGNPAPELQHTTTDGKTLSLFKVVEPSIRTAESVFLPGHRQPRDPTVGSAVLVEDAVKHLTARDASLTEALNEIRVVGLVILASELSQVSAIDKDGYGWHRTRI